MKCDNKNINNKKTKTDYFSAERDQSNNATEVFCDDSNNNKEDYDNNIVHHEYQLCNDISDNSSLEEENHMFNNNMINAKTDRFSAERD